MTAECPYTLEWAAPSPLKIALSHGDNWLSYRTKPRGAVLVEMFLTATELYDNKSSPVAEMGDCATAKWAEKWGAGDDVPLSVGEGELGPHLTQCAWPGLRPTFIPTNQVAS